MIWSPDNLRDKQRIARWTMKRWAVDPPTGGDLKTVEDELTDEIGGVSDKESLKES